MANQVNYNQEMKKIMESTDSGCTLLLHACCAPCSSTCMERVRGHFDTGVYFYNPNITSIEEYDKRSVELQRLIDIYNESGENRITFIEGEYNPRDFTQITKGYEDCPERGERCERCYELRLRSTALMAKELGYDYFTTTLTLSPLKDTVKLNEIGYRLADEIGGAKWLPSDFKKDGGYQRSIELSKEYGLYRQNYCGCVYSKR